MKINDKDRLSFREFINSIIWVLKMYWKFSPLYLSIYIFTSILNNLRLYVFSYLTAYAIDKAVSVSGTPNPVISDLYPIAIVFTIFYAISQLVGRINNYTINAINNSTDKLIRLEIFKKLKLLGIQSLENPELNNLTDRARSNLHYLNRQLNWIVNLIGSIASFIVSGLVLLSAAPIFIPLYILASIPLILIDRIYNSKIWILDKNLTEQRRSAYDSASYLIEPKSLQELLITGGHKIHTKNFKRFIHDWIDKYKQILKKWYTLTYIGGFLRTIFRIFAYIYIYWQVVIAKITIGTATFQVRTVQAFGQSVLDISRYLSSIYEAAQRINELKGVFDLKPIFEDGNIKMKELINGPSITFKNASFTYPNADRPVIPNLNLDIKSGEKIAIVGHNGAGKTTLVKLICRFYQLNKGSLLINDININDLKINSYYQNLSVLFQDFNRYTNLTAKQNIYISSVKKKNRKNKVKEAAKMADAHDFIMDYDKKYQKILSERYKGGTRPSTGQWQKIAIARFFYRNTPLVIFDEPTAAIDAESEKRIFNKIYKFFKNKTVIIISHRFSTVRNADRIIVMNKGQIVEHGSHKELMALNGKYAKAFNLQAQGYKK